MIDEKKNKKHMIVFAHQWCDIYNKLWLIIERDVDSLNAP